MTDEARVRRLLGVLGTYRARLAELRDLPVEIYIAREAFAGRYLVQAAAQVCIDLANHVIAAEGWRVPDSFRDAFTVLQEHNVVHAHLAARLRALSGLRNRLVHLYEDVDDRLVHAALEEGLADLDAYARAVAALLDTPEQ